MNEFAGDERTTRPLNVVSNGLAYILTGGVTSHSPHDDENHRGVDEENDWLDLGMVDVEAETESMRHEAEARLRAQSNELKRFHDKICLRVTERERHNRLEAERAQKYLDAKCARVFSTTELSQQSEKKTTAARISTRPFFQKMKEDKKVMLKDCPLGKHIEKMLTLDAQIRDDLLRSTETSSSQSSNNGYENGGSEDVSEPAATPALLPEQRVALYATVRRQYMEMNRAKVKNNVWRGDSQSPDTSKEKSPVSKTLAAGRGSRTRGDNTDHNGIGERWSTTSTGVKVIDITSGCDVRVHRQTTTSSTPWRKKSAKGSKAQTTTKEHERFLRALQAQLGTPALCSCAKGESNSTSSTPCANNCALYKQPKTREKLLTSVYKQQQQDVSTAASPIR
ncbi:hypothetical protein PC129_g9172 [Phytophthora cactorum]|uniref:Uncharacterized protein n=1 Tax=Phytophthora cactorum TaxID=29920 RepID=A0A8T0Z3M6_9STRA|nr:hypothetical protein PC112_g11110 [Phytophthora cactorum]KAG2856582.1 hypothetical protein PC113_g11443 [Phytophthora cactorum]KAG2903762.1 hypothetical protein PC114_g12125 [Phytophthora cactorum]KAG2918785.1 hypothetical protein PC115_g10353 [Phytophthora cactorum]KAG2937080.1 hypothetical protein PC117_g11843 [Phytophthora cactorum]